MLNLFEDLLGNVFIFLLFGLSGYYGRYIFNYFTRKKIENWRYEVYSGFFWWNFVYIIIALILGLFTNYLNMFVKLVGLISSAILLIGFILEFGVMKKGFLFNASKSIIALKNEFSFKSMLVLYIIINLLLFLTFGLSHRITAWDESVLWLPYAKLFFESNGIPPTEEILAGYTTYHAVVPLLYAFPFFLFNSFNSYFRLIPLAYLILLLILIYDIAKELSDSITALIATATFTALPIIQYYMQSSTFYADLQTLFFFTFAIWHFIKGVSKSSAKAVVYGGFGALLAILSKFQGLAIFVVLYGITLMFIARKIRVFLSILGGAALFGALIMFSQQLFSLNDILGIAQMHLSGLILFLIILWLGLTEREEKTFNFKAVIIYFAMFVIIAFLGLSWYWRSYILTGNLFYPQGGNPWFTEIITEAWFASGLYNKAFDVISATTLPFLLLSYGGPLFFFKIEGVKRVVSLRNPKASSLLAWIFWYQFTWIAIFGMQNIRYCIYLTPPSVILVAFGINKIKVNLKLADYEPLTVPVFTGILLLAMGYAWFPVYLGPIAPFLYPLLVHLKILATNIGYSLIASTIIYYSIKKMKLFDITVVIKLKNQIIRLSRYKLVAILILIVYLNSVNSLYIPIANAGGWINYRNTAYPMNHYQLVYEKIRETTDSDDFVLSFYTSGIYYFTGRKVLNMGFYTDSRLDRLKPLFNTGNMTFALQYLKKLQIKDIVVLTPRNKLYKWYYELTENAYFLKALRNNRLFSPILDNDSLIFNIYSPNQDEIIYYGIFAVEAINDRSVNLLGTTKADRKVLLGYNDTLKLRMYYDFCMLNLSEYYQADITLNFEVKLWYKSFSISYTHTLSTKALFNNSWGYKELFTFNPKTLIRNFPKETLQNVTISILDLKLELKSLYKNLIIRIAPFVDKNSITFNFKKGFWFIPIGSSYLIERIIE